MRKHPTTQSLTDVLRTALTIRSVENRLLSLFSEGKLVGTVHTCIGQELIGPAIAAELRPTDWVFSNHRGHGHFISLTDDVEGLVAEVMGRETGVCRGRGGTQHLHQGRFFSNGIQGGMVPIAAGVALACRGAAGEDIAVAFIGDGTLGEGILYEALNLAAVWELPLLLVVENNRYAQSTASHTTTAGTVQSRAEAFGIRYAKATTWNLDPLEQQAREAVAFVREGRGPMVLEIETDRLKPHSKGDETRPPDLMDAFQRRDLLAQLLAEREPEVEEHVRAANERIETAIEAADLAPESAYRPSSLHTAVTPAWEPLVGGVDEGLRMNEAIHRALRAILDANPRSYLLGEDIEGPYGGAFKVTQSLSQQYPGRVRNCPISEAAIVGIANGLALSGHTAIAEIMFGDFITLAVDQLLQHAAKFGDMYGVEREFPLIVRTPMGGGRGYGPTHSQSLEKLLIGHYGLGVFALNGRISPERIYTELASGRHGASLVIENKVLYTRPIRYEAPKGFGVFETSDPFPTVRVSPLGATPDVTLFCYGGMLDVVEAELARLFYDHEILAEIICPTRLTPMDFGPLVESVRRTGRLVTIEEGSGFAALGAEAIAQLADRGVKLLACGRVNYAGLIPASQKREVELLPSGERIRSAVVSVVHG